MTHAMTKASDRSPSRCFLWLVAAGAMTLVAACGGGGSDDTAKPAGGGPTATTGNGGGSEVSPTQLDIDPCTLLTIPEMEEAIGAGVERGGFGKDPPGRCNYSIGGDVGAGAVGITNGDPLLCAALQRAIDAGPTGRSNDVAVDVGDGGIVDAEGGLIQFAIGGGCISITAGESGVGIDQEALVALAEAAAGRAG